MPQVVCVFLVDCTLSATAALLGVCVCVCGVFNSSLGGVSQFNEHKYFDSHILAVHWVNVANIEVFEYVSVYVEFEYVSVYVELEYVSVYVEFVSY